MSDIKITVPDRGGSGGEGRGEGEGERGHRGHRGHRGATGPAGSAGPTGPTGPIGPSSIIGRANVAIGGAFIGTPRGIASVVQTGVGLYTVTLTDPATATNNIAVELSLRSGFAPGMITYLPTSPTTFDVDIFDQLGVSADRDFTVVVYDNGIA